MNTKKIIIGIIIALVVLLAAYFTVTNSVMTQKGISGSSFMAGDEVGMGETSISEPGLTGMGGRPSGMMQEKSAASVPSYNSNSTSALNVSDSSDQNLVGQDKKVIKNGNLTLKVNSVDRSAEEIGSVAKNNGGDVFSSNFYKKSSNLKSGTIVVKVPVANFEKTYSEIKKVASVVVREGTSGQDVTEEYQDLEGRIKNKQAEEEAYKNILGQAQKISDILEVTQALTNVRAEIESLQGRLKYLGSLSDMATISVNLSEDADITVTDSWRPLQVAKDAFNSLIQKSQGFVNFLILLIITVIPVALLYLFLGWMIYWIGRKVYGRFWKKNQL